MITLKKIKEIWRWEIITYRWEEALEAVKQDWYALQYVKERTSEICLEAVKQNWDALQYVKEQTPEICLEAVKENWDALQYVDESIFEEVIPEYTFEELQEKLWEKFILKK